MLTSLQFVLFWRLWMWRWDFAAVKCRAGSTRWDRGLLDTPKTNFPLTPLTESWWNERNTIFQKLPFHPSICLYTAIKRKGLDTPDVNEMDFASRLKRACYFGAGLSSPTWPHGQREKPCWIEPKWLARFIAWLLLMIATVHEQQRRLDSCSPLTVCCLCTLGRFSWEREGQQTAFHSVLSHLRRLGVVYGSTNWLSNLLTTLYCRSTFESKTLNCKIHFGGARYIKEWSKK